MLSAGPGPDQPLGRRQRLRRAGRQFPRHRHRRLGQFGIRNDLGDDAHRERLRRRDHRIGQQDRHRPAQADQPRQRDGNPGVRRHRDARRAREEFGGFAGDDDIGGADEAKAAAARGKALHRRNHRRLQPQQSRHRVLQIGRRLPDIVGQLLALRRKRANVAAGAKILALAAQQQHAQVRLAMADHDGVAQRAQEVRRSCRWRHRGRLSRSRAMPSAISSRTGPLSIMASFRLWPARSGTRA